MPFGWSVATYLAQNYSRFLALCVQHVDFSTLGYTIPSAVPSSDVIANVYIDFRFEQIVPFLFSIKINFF